MVGRGFLVTRDRLAAPLDERFGRIEHDHPKSSGMGSGSAPGGNARGGNRGSRRLGDEGGTEFPGPRIRHITPGDLREVWPKVSRDFGAYRTDVIFLCVIYPVVGLILAQFAFQRDMFQLLFPLASGFALIGPFAGVGLYEMSRRREQGVTVNWADAFGVLRSPSFGAILALGFMLVAIFLLWLFAAQANLLGHPGTRTAGKLQLFIREVFTTSAGWALIVLGIGVGFLFAVLVLAISVVSFPLLLDRKVGVATAVWTSVRVVMANPSAMAGGG